MKITLEINGEERALEVEPRTLLVHALRDGLGLTGTKVGCETTQCGACTVLVDGKAAKSCSILAVMAQGRAITTIEGLAPAGANDVQEAFRSNHGVQCGYCTPGMIMTATDLLSRDPDPSLETIRRALAGNLCRCTGYETIAESVKAVAAERSGAA